MSAFDATVVFVTSFLAIPLCYFSNYAFMAMQSKNETVVFFIGSASILLVALITWSLIRINTTGNTNRTHSFTVMSVFSLASVVDLIMALELDGIIEGFVSFYLKHGEPYLKTAHGTVICYWDGIMHYGLYLSMLSAMAWNQSYHEVGLYWVGSIAHSMIVLVLGALTGKYGIKWSFLLNVPYCVIPVWIGVRLLREPVVLEKGPTVSNNIVAQKSILKRPTDVCLILYLIFASGIAIVRGMACLESPADFTKQYKLQYEPYLADPGKFGTMQMLTYLFYFLPYYFVSVYGLLNSGCSWMLDWSILHAGAAAQAQVSYIGSSLHYRTPYLLRVPQDLHVQVVFWSVNLSLLIIPQLLMYRVIQYPEFFIHKAEMSSMANDSDLKMLNSKHAKQQ